MTMVDRDNAFECILGGITLRNTSKIVGDQKMNAADSFFYPKEKKECLISNQKILVDYSLLPEGKYPERKGKVCSPQCPNFYERASGDFELFDKPGITDNPLWSVVVDPEFSRFSYRFCPEVFRKINFPRFAVNIFLLQHSFLNHNGLIIHATGGSVQGKGIVFAAPSGTGKSTLTRLLLLDLHNRIFSEDRLIARSVGERCWNLWGTPWVGENEVTCNECIPLAALVFLTQAPKTSVTTLTPSVGLHRLLQVASIPWYSEKWIKKGLAVCERLVQGIPVFELAFRPDQSAVQAVKRLADEL